MSEKIRTFEATLLRCDETYPSERTYPWELMDKAVEDYNKKSDQLFIEAEGNTACEVDMTKVVGVINDLHMVGKDVRGTVILLDTPEANKLKDLTLDITLFGHGDVD